MQDIVAKIKTILTDIRPHILMDGGDIEFISFDNGIVSLRLHGACVGCPMSSYTLKLGIEERLKQQIPEVLQVKAIN